MILKELLHAYENVEKRDVFLNDKDEFLKKELLFFFEYIRKDEIGKLKQIEEHQNIDVQDINFIITEKNEFRNVLFNSLKDILTDKNPINKIKGILSLQKKSEPTLPIIDKRILGKIVKYLKIHNIEKKDFNKWTRSFLFTLSRVEQKKWSTKQIDILKKLIHSDHKMFNNKYLVSEGFEEECRKIQEYYNLIK